MTRSLSLAAVFAALAAAAVVLPSSAPACAPAPQKGEEVRISDEAALIVWDEATKTEHFIRRANFQSTSADFGFLVPTPSKPDVGPADDAVFNQLAAITAPKVETRVVRKTRAKSNGQSKDPPMPTAQPGAAGSAPPPRGSVEVLDRKQFDGIEATVLAFKRGPGDADPTFGAEELAKWLQKHGYEFGPTLVAWLKPYVANDWVMTAFRIAATDPKGPGSGPPAASRPAYALRGVPVRMSFKTERPFYPYREPTSQREEPKADSQFGPRTARFLRVYFVSAGRVDGTLGDAKSASQWPGKTVWANKLNAGQLSTVVTGAKLPKEGAPGGELWLTEFEDYSSPRPGTDEVYFAAGKDQTAVARPPIIREIVEELDPPPEPDSGKDSAGPMTIFTVVAVVVSLVLVAGFIYFIVSITRR